MATEPKNKKQMKAERAAQKAEQVAQYAVSRVKNNRRPISVWINAKER